MQIIHKRVQQIRFLKNFDGMLADLALMRAGNLSILSILLGALPSDAQWLFKAAGIAVPESMGGLPDPLDPHVVDDTEVMSAYLQGSSSPPPLQSGLRHLSSHSLNASSIVVSLSRKLHPVAAFHAKAAEAQLCLVGSADEFLQEFSTICGFAVRTVTLFVDVNNISIDQIHRIHAHFAVLPSLAWGMFPSCTPAEASWQSVKSLLYAQLDLGRHLLVDSAAPSPNLVPDSSTVVFGSQNIDEFGAPDLDHDWDFIALAGHGDEADIYLRTGYLCSRVGTQPARIGTNSSRTIRCTNESCCYRSMGTSLTGDRTNLISAATLRVRWLMLNCCSSGIVSADGRYGRTNSLALQACNGLPGAVIATLQTRRHDPYEAILFSKLIMEGITAGQAVLALNRLQTSLVGSSMFILFGDPTLRRAPREHSVDQCMYLKEGTTYLPKHSFRVFSHSDSKSIEADWTIYSSPRVRAFWIDTEERQFLIGFNEGSAAGTIDVVQRRQTNQRAEFSDSDLEELLCRLREDDSFSSTSRVQRNAAAETVIELRRVNHLQIFDSRRPKLRATLEELLGERLAVIHQALCRDLLFQSTMAVTGPTLDIPQDELEYGAEIRTHLPCPNCNATLSVVQSINPTLTVSRRDRYVCPRCTIVADVPEFQQIPGLECTPCITAGSKLVIDIRLNTANVPYLGMVVGVGLLGARGKSVPSFAQFGPIERAAHARIVLAINSDITPGSYQLKMLICANASLFTRLRPIVIAPARAH